MRTPIIALTLAAVLTGGIASQAAAKGCIKGALAGGVAGHFAGHHGLLGAAGGCVVGRHYANKRAREDAAQQQMDGAPAQ